MLWFIFALLSAFLGATYFALTKKYLKNINEYSLAAGTFIFSGLILFLISIINGIPQIGEKFITSTIITVLINILATVLYYKALKISDISLTIPILSFSPLFIILTSYLILNELPNVSGVIGILLIVIGSYILNSSKTKKGFLKTISTLFKNKGSIYMLIVAFLFSISSNYDKLVVLNSDIYFGSSLTLLVLGIIFSIISIIKKDHTLFVKNNIPIFILLGALLSVAGITVNYAFTLQIVPYVISVKRLSILFSVIYGMILFKEKEMKNRITGSIIMIVGVIFIIVF